MKNTVNRRLQIEQENLSAIIAMSNQGELLKCCPICQWQHPSYKLYSVHQCGHIFCIDCQTKNIEQHVANIKYPICPQQNCKVQLSENSELYEFLDVTLKNKIKKIKNYKKVLANNQLKLCQKADCSGLFYITKQFICQECGSKHCKICNKLAHQGECQLQVAISLQMNNKFRQCSVCGSVIQKTQGCTHIQCTCGNYFCYSCGETLTSDHLCKHPQHLSFIQKIRWELQHLELWYEKNNCSCLRLILCFSPPKSYTFKQNIIWVLVYFFTFYPLLIVLTLTMMVLATAIILVSILVCCLLLPLLGLCASKLELFPTYAISQTYGYCVGFFVVLLFYPILIVINLIQVIYQLTIEQDIQLHQILIPFSQMLQGLKYVVLSPCLMLVSIQEVYVQNAQQREPAYTKLINYNELLQIQIQQ